MLAVTFATLFLAIALYTWVPKGFFPIEETGFISGTVEARTDIGFPSMRAHLREVSAAVRKDPAVSYVVSSPVRPTSARRKIPAASSSR